MYFKLLLVFSIICAIRAEKIDETFFVRVYCVSCNVPWNSVCPYGLIADCGSFVKSVAPVCVHYKHTNANGQSFLIKGCGEENYYPNKTACERINIDNPNSSDCQQCATPYCNYKSDRYTYL